MVFFGVMFENGDVAQGTEAWVCHMARVLRRMGRDVRVVFSQAVFGVWVDVEDVELPPVHNTRSNVMMNIDRGNTEPALSGKEVP